MNRWIKVFLFLEAISLAFAVSFTALDDFDVFWHLKCGELFIKKFAIFHEDIFSYTVAGAPWVDGYLPAQALLYMGWLLGGPAGVVALGSLLSAGSYGLALLISRRGSREGFGAALAASIPAVYLAFNALVPRPALLSPTFALVTLWLLEDHRLRGGRRIYWLLPLTTLWANCHPGFVTGPVITAIYITGQVLGDRPVDQPDGPEPHRARLDLLLIGQVIATLVNPYGPLIYLYAVQVPAFSEMNKSIVEWQPLFSPIANSAGIVPCCIIVTAVWVACLIWSGRRTQATHVLMFFFLIAATLYARRNLILLGPLSLPLIAWTVNDGIARPIHNAPLRRYRHGEIGVKLGAALLIAAGLALIWFVATNRLYFYTKSRRYIGAGISSTSFPTKGAELLKNEPVAGNLLHTYQSGGYILFELFPKFHTYTDGRLYIFPSYLFKVEQDSKWFEKEFVNARRRYDIRAALLPISPKFYYPALGLFLYSPRWAAVAADEWGVLFLARGAGNDDVIRRHEIDLLKNPPLFNTPQAGKAFHWWSGAVYPHGPVRWAMFYYALRRPDLSARALAPALQYMPMRKALQTQYDELLQKAGQLEFPER